MAKGGISHFFENHPSSVSTESDYWLKRRPILSVVCAVIRTTRWHQLGIQLELDNQNLNEIDKDNSSIGLKRTKMFELWLDTQPDATNEQLLKALRLKVIGEDKLADDYEEKIKTDHSTLTTKHDFTTRQDMIQTPVYLDAPKNTENAVKCMVQASDSVSLVIQAEKLKGAYLNLLDLVQYYASQNARVENIKNRLKSTLEMKSLYPQYTIALYCQQIDKFTKVDDAFKFLVDNHFVSYLNFKILEDLSHEIHCGKEGSKIVEVKLSEYKKLYGKFLEEPSFGKVIAVFDKNPHLNPSTIIGLPIIVIQLALEWKEKNNQDLAEWLPFIKEKGVLLQSMGYKCILITYAVFPIDLLHIMDFITHPANIKTLKENGITIEIPTHTLNMATTLREDNNLENESKYNSLSMLVKQLADRISFLEGQRIADNAYWITQVTLLKANQIVDREKMKEIEEDLDYQDQVSSKTQIAERKYQRLNKTRASTRVVKPEEIDKLSKEFETSGKLLPTPKNLRQTNSTRTIDSGVITPQCSTSTFASQT